MPIHITTRALPVILRKLLATLPAPEQLDIMVIQTRGPGLCCFDLFFLYFLSIDVDNHPLSVGCPRKVPSSFLSRESCPGRGHLVHVHFQILVLTQDSVGQQAILKVPIKK